MSKALADRATPYSVGATRSACCFLLAPETHVRFAQATPHRPFAIWGGGWRGGVNRVGRPRTEKGDKGLGGGGSRGKVPGFLRNDTGRRKQWIKRGG